MLKIKFTAKKNFFITIIITILFLFTLFLSGCINTSNENSNGVIYGNYYSYSLFITSNDSDSYKINVPIPINDLNESTEDFFKNIGIYQGTAILNDTVTLYGKGLEIIAQGNIELRSKFNHTSKKPIDSYYSLLSMTKISDEWDGLWEIGYSWIFSNKENITLKINFNSSQGIVNGSRWGSHYEINSQLENDWQQVLARYQAFYN